MYTLTEAAKAVGKSRAALSKAIRTGKLVASKDSTGRYVIAPVDLHKAYPVNAVADAVVDNLTSATDNRPTGDPVDVRSDQPVPVTDNLTSATDNRPAGGTVDARSDQPAPVADNLTRATDNQPTGDTANAPGDQPAPVADNLTRATDNRPTGGTALGDLRSDLAALRSTVVYSVQQVNATLTARPGFLARSLMALPVAWCVLSGVYVAGFFLAFGPNAFWRVGQLSFSALVGTLLSYWPF